MSMLLLLLAVSLALAAEPGVKLAVTNKGLDYANQVAGTELRNKLQTLSIPNQSGSDGSRSWEIKNIQIKGMSGPNTHISLNPGEGGLTLGVSNFGINLHADWSLKYRIIFKITSKGSVDLSVSGASVTLVAGLGEKNGRPSVFAKSCSCNVGDIGINFHGGFVAWILNLFKGTVRSKIKNVLQDKVCDFVKEQVNTRGDEELSRMNVNVEFANHFILDYSLIRAPTVTGNFVEAAAKGTVYWKDNRQEGPFTPAVVPALSEFSDMLYVYVTEYSANTFAYVAHVNHYLQYNITLDNLPSEMSDMLQPIGKLKDYYPNTKMELRISSSSAPSFKFESQKLTVTAAVILDVAAQTPEGVISPLSLGVNVSVVAESSVANGHLTGRITDYRFTIGIIRSNFGEINEEELNTLIKDSIEKVAIPGLNEFGKQGIALPVTSLFRLYNIKLNLQTGYLQVATDVEYLQ